MSEEKKRILEMLSQNKITVDEAERLLAAMDTSSNSGSEPSPGKANPKYLRVQVEPVGPKSDGERVNVRVPMNLIRAGLKWVQDKGLDAIHEHEMKLARMLRDGLKDIPHVTLYCQEDLENHIAVLAFNVEGLDAADVGTMIDVDHNIACRTGLHCAPLVHEQLDTVKLHGSVRFSIGPFNTESHILAAIEAVRETVAFNKRQHQPSA